MLSILVFATVQFPQIHATNSSTKDKLLEYLSDVNGLDLTKYTLTQRGYGSSYPAKFGGFVEEESLSCTLEAVGSKIDIMSIFDNGQLVFCSSSVIGNYIYATSQPPDILNQARVHIQKYQPYATQKYSSNTSHLTSMQNMLNNVATLSPVNVTDGNMNLQISQNDKTTHIQLACIQNGILLSHKRIQMTFVDNNLTDFIDTWNLYTIGGFSQISSDEALQIALNAAKNYDLALLYQNEKNETVSFEPDWSKTTYDIRLSMIPGRLSNKNPSENSILLPTNTSRNPLALYPLWQIHFYFNKPVGDVIGMQVGVWGDTKEIHYCSDYGFYGASMTAGEESHPTDQQPASPPINLPSVLLNDTQTQEKQQPETFNLLILLVCIAVIVSITFVARSRLTRHNQGK